MIAISEYAVTANSKRPIFDKVWLDEEVYRAALGSLPLSCVDVVPFHRATSSLVLAERRLKPGAGVWMFGGRVNIGETLHAAALRHVKHDLGLTISPVRLDLLSVNQYFFDERQQSPQEMPCHSICFVFGFPISDNEYETSSRFIGLPEYVSGSLHRTRPPYDEYGVRGKVFEGLHRACKF